MTIRIEKAGGVVSLAFDRPERRNAITAAMYAQLAEGLAQAGADRSVRVVVLHGDENVFTAGNDLGDFRDNPPQGTDTPVQRFLQGLLQFDKPLVAAVCGHAVGVGTTMLLHCDLVYAGENARLQLPFVNLALVPEAGSSRLLPEMLGHRRAAELLMLGDMFDARRAVELGIVNATCPDGNAYAHAYERAQALAAKPPEALRLTKELMKRGQREMVRDQMQVESALFAERLASPEAREAMLAFMERRKPDFSRFN